MDAEKNSGTDESDSSESSEIELKPRLEAAAVLTAVALNCSMLFPLEPLCRISATDAPVFLRELRADSDRASAPRNRNSQPTQVIKLLAPR